MYLIIKFLHGLFFLILQSKCYLIHCCFVLLIHLLFSNYCLAWSPFVMKAKQARYIYPSRPWSCNDSIYLSDSLIIAQCWCLEQIGFTWFARIKNIFFSLRMNNKRKNSDKLIWFHDFFFKISLLLIQKRSSKLSLA